MRLKLIGSPMLENNYIRSTNYNRQESAVGMVLPIAVVSKMVKCWKNKRALKTFWKNVAS